MSSMIGAYKIQPRNQRVHQLDTTHLDIVDLGLESIMPADLKSFWS